MILTRASQRLAVFKQTYGASYGVHAGAGQAPFPLMHGASARQVRAHRDATITAALFGVRNPDVFDPNYLRLPVYQRVAPLGAGHNRWRLALAAASQHAVQLTISLARASIAAAYLVTGQFREAWQMQSNYDEATRTSLVFAHELLILPTVYNLYVLYTGRLW